MFKEARAQGSSAIVAEAQAKGFARHIFIASALAAIALLFLLHGNPFSGRVFTGGDILDFNLPARKFYQDALRSGDSVLWNPRQYCGYYQHAEGQGGYFHPEHYLLYRLLPLAVAYNLESFLMYVTFWTGTFLLLRCLTFPAYAASVGALTTTFCGFNLLHYGHINAIEVLSHTPWTLLAVYYLVVRSERNVIAVAAISLALLKASQILMGHPFSLFVSTLAEIAFAAWLLCNERKEGATVFSQRSLRRLGLYGAALAVGVLLGGVQLQPTRDLVKHSGRKRPDFQFRMSFSSHPTNLLSLWSPYVLIEEHKDTTFVGSKIEDNPYNGILSLFCLTWCWARWRHLGNQRTLIAAAVVSLFSVILSLGYYGYLWRCLSFLPILNSFRCSGRFIILAHLAAMAFTACAFTDLIAVGLGHRPNLNRRETLILATPVFLSAVSVIPALLLQIPGLPSLLQYRLQNNFSDISHALIGVGMTLFAFLSFLALARWRAGRIGVIYALMAFTVADLGYHWSTVYLFPLKAETIPVLLREMSPLPKQEGGRVMTGEDRLRPLLQSENRMANGYAGLYPEKTLPLQSGDCGPYDPRNDSVALRLASVQWTRPKSAGGQPDLTRWLPVPDPLPRVRLVSSVVISDDIPKTARFFDVSRVALIDPGTARSAPELQAEKGVTHDEATPLPGEARIVRERNAEKEVLVRASAPCCLILSESYHSGWTVTREGKPYPVYRAYGDYLMCRVEPGEHRYQFRFAPRSFETGKELTLIGVIAVLLMGLTVRYLLPARFWK